MAERLKTFLQTYIAEEQAGFLPGRHITDNIRNLINMIEYYDKRIDKGVAFSFADAEKAFDYVNWDFMKLLIKKLDLGEQFGNAINAIYTYQSATLIINSENTNPFSIEKGSRQGCRYHPC